MAQIPGAQHTCRSCAPTDALTEESSDQCPADEAHKRTPTFYRRDAEGTKARREKKQLQLHFHRFGCVSFGCVSTELETLPQVELKADLCADLLSKTEYFGIENGNLREGCSLSN